MGRQREVREPEEQWRNLGKHDVAADSNGSELLLRSSSFLRRSEKKMEVEREREYFFGLKRNDGNLVSSINRILSGCLITQYLN